MARTNESTNAQEPALPDQQGWRHWGDGLAGKLFGVRMQGFYPTAADYRDVQVDVNGVVQTSGGGAGGGGAATIADGADVAQGTTTDLAWTSGAGTVISLLKKIASAGGSAVSVADGADVAQGTTTDPSTSLTVIGLLKAVKALLAAKLLVTADPITFAAPQHIIVDTVPVPVSDNAGSLTVDAPVATPVFTRLSNGTVAIDTLPVTGPLTDAQLRASAVPVTIPVPAPISDNAGSLTVDAPVGTPVFVRLSDGAAALVGQKTMALSLPVALASDQGAVPNNLSQIAGTALAAKALPTNADGQVAIPVYVNSQQYATYDVAARNIATGALTANTAKAVLSLEHALASTKTVRIRRIMIHALQTTALAGLFDVQITRGTAASSAGTGVTPQPRRITDPAAEVVVKSLPTIVAATVADNIPAGGFGATTALYSPPVLVYDWQEAGETKPYMLVAGALQSLVINVISTVAHNLTLTISVDLTEE